MSDLISKKALLEALRNIQKYAPISLECAKNSLGDYFYDTDIINLINSAPAVNGDVYLEVATGAPMALKWLRINDLKDGSKLWSAPPQPQSAKDALEKAAKICYEITANTKYQSIICYDMASELMRRIRKLIEVK
jgi:hypothetical protein